MPREPIELVRESNFRNPEKFFILAYEGNVAEPRYFEALKEIERYNDEQIHLVSLKRQKKDGRSDPKNVFKKLKGHSKEHNLKKTDEYWMVIDRDAWNCLDEICELCKAEGNYFIALSNPCFEFWLFLHLKDLEEYSEEEIICLNSNKKVNASKNYIEVVLGDLLSGGYNKSRVKVDRFLPHIQNAIERAEKLDVNKNESYPKEIGTHVYRLVKKLLKE